MRRPGQLAIAAIVINGALYVILSFTRFLPFVALVLACIGMFQGIHMSLSQTIVQLLVPAHMRGRVMAVWMINWGLMPLGLLPLSATAERLGTPVAMAIGGSLSLCVGVFVALWGRQLWGLTGGGDARAWSSPAAPRTVLQRRPPRATLRGFAAARAAPCGSRTSACRPVARRSALRSRRRQTVFPRTTGCAMGIPWP